MFHHCATAFSINHRCRKNHSAKVKADTGSGKYSDSWIRTKDGRIWKINENLQSEKLLGASIDVFPKEPKSNTEPFESELMGLPNTILTPHIGGSTYEAQKNIGNSKSNALVNSTFSFFTAS